MLRVKSGDATSTLSMKIYQCMNCHSVFKNEADRDSHGENDPTHQKMREYELEEFLTRFLVAA